MQDTLKLAIHIGDKALGYLYAKEFQLKWRSLCEICPWVTVFQGQDFVLPWYEIYQEKYYPVIIFGESSDNKLAGLLTLALSKHCQRLTAAGDAQAEYQCWLETPSGNNRFIKAALSEIKKRFPRADLYLKYIPPKTPLDWLDDHKGLNTVFKSHPRPLMLIDELSMSQQRRTKNNRHHYNRLSKCGEVQFERITDHNQFLDLFDEICNQYDFRHGAIHNIAPFAEDPLKKPFHAALHKRGVLHTTVLRVGGRIAASSAGLISKEYVHNAINTHSPVFARDSPGTLLLAMLGVLLAKEGIPVFDLTPGADPYKANFAIVHDTVFELNIYANLKARCKNEALRFVRQSVKEMMRKTGFTSKEARLALARVRKVKETGILAIACKILEAAMTPARVYRFAANERDNVRYAILISKDSLADLVLFDANDSGGTRQGFLATAMERLEKGSHTYTYAKHGKLLLCCWAKKLAAKSTQPVTRQNGPFAGNSAVLSDLYVHTQVKDMKLVRGFIDEILSDLTAVACIEGIYLAGAFRRDLKECLQQLGFVEEGDLRVRPGQSR